jgi:CheY-like chemotaxis protein
MEPKVLIVDDNQEFLNLLARLFTDAGYQVILSGRGKTALEMARTEKPVLTVLDILLPDMMGYHLAEVIRRELGTPIIFITGVFKGGKHAQEAKTKYGAIAYFEKPFEASKLIETAKSVVAPVAKSSSKVNEEDSFDVELDVDVDEEPDQDPLELTGLVRVTGGDAVSAELKGEPLTAGAYQAGTAKWLRPPPVNYPVAPAPIVEAERGIRRGELRDNLPSLINAFYQSQETGELGVQRGKVKKVVYFEKGQPVYAFSNLVADRFGQFLVRVGKLNETQLQKAAAQADVSHRRLGDVLEEMGLLKSETEQLYFLGQHVKSIVYSLFGWEEGIYELAFKRSAAQEPLKLDTHPANLIMRGIKKLYKLERLRRLLGPEAYLRPSLQPAYTLKEIELEKWEAELLPSADGTRTVKELITLANKPEHEAHGFIYGLVALSVLEQHG